MIALVSLLAGLAAALAVLAAGSLLQARRDRLRERLGRQVGLPAPAPSPAPAPGAATPATGGAGPRRPGARVAVGMERLQAAVSRAGLPLRANEFLGLLAAAALLGAVAAYALLPALPFAVMGACGGALVPAWLLAHLQQRRARAFQELLPDALLLLANALRAGHSLAGALALAARELPAPMGPELARAVREARLGASLDVALTRMAARVRSRDLELALTGILINRSVGGNLAELLEHTADMVRSRIRLRWEVRTITAQGRFSAIVLILLVPVVALAVFLFNPDFILLLFQEPLGWVMLLLGAILQAMGVILIRRIIQVHE